MIARFVTVALAAGLCAAGTHAAEQGDDCNIYDDLGIKHPFQQPAPAPSLMVVAPRQDRLHFLKGGFVMQGSDNVAGCPSDTARCMRKAYLAAGDMVIVTSTSGAYSCATYTGGAPSYAMTSGFLPTAALAAAATKPAPDWAGAWKVSFDRVIRVTPADGGVVRISLQSEFPNIPNNGTVSPFAVTTVTPKGATIAFSVDSTASVPMSAGPVGADPTNDQLCRVQLWRLGPYLVDGDNGCLLGNHGTSSGVYRLSR